MLPVGAIDARNRVGVRRVLDTNDKAQLAIADIDNEMQIGA
jgi:hypothetical protein